MWEYGTNNWIHIDEHLSWDLVENNLFIYSSRFTFRTKAEKASEESVHPEGELERD